MDIHTTAAIALGAFLIAVGASHFVIPGYYARLVPSWMPAARTIVIVTGVAELVVGTLVLLPATRTLGGWAAVALITTYLVSHLDALARCRDHPWTDPMRGPPGAVARLVVNGAYIAWAWWAATGA